MFRKLATVATVAVVAIAGVAAPASANNTSTVDRAEFVKATIGLPYENVKAIFDASGTKTSEFSIGSSKYQTREYKGAYGEHSEVSVDYKYYSGKWRVASRSAFWYTEPLPSANKATRAEFLKVTSGMTLDQVRRTFGSTGTLYHEYISSSYKRLVVLWPSSTGEEVEVDFTYSKGAWRMSSKSSRWFYSPAQTTNKATKTEYSAVKTGMTIDQVRRTFGTTGTLGFEYASKNHKTISLMWPVDSEWGEVEVDFEHTNGAYRVADKYAYWG